MISLTTAKIVARAYDYHVGVSHSGNILLYRRDPKTNPNSHVCTIFRDGEIIPITHPDRLIYNRADHECAMAIRATLPLRK